MSSWLERHERMNDANSRDDRQWRSNRLGFHERAGACQAPRGVAVNSPSPTLRHTFRLASIRTLNEPSLGSVPVEVPRKGGRCHLEMTISKDQSLARSHPNAAVH
jgi:hypothetical protein